MTNCYNKAWGFFFFFWVNDFVCENVRVSYVCALNGCESLPYVGHLLIGYSLGRVSSANGGQP
jgi:hypothetical protein